MTEKIPTQLTISDAPSSTGQCLSLRPLLGFEDEPVRRCGDRVGHSGAHWAKVTMSNKLKFRVYW